MLLFAPTPYRKSKPNCFDTDKWQKDFLERVSMEQAASVL